MLSDVVLLLDEAGTVLFVSDSVQRVLQVPQDALAGRSVLAVMQSESGRLLLDTMARVVATHRTSMVRLALYSSTLYFQDALGNFQNVWFEEHFLHVLKIFS